MNALTAFHDPRRYGQALVSVRDESTGNRVLIPVRRRQPRVVLRSIADGTLSDGGWPGFWPAHGEIIGDHAYYALPPEWRVNADVQLPTEEPDWLRCVLLFVWGPAKISALACLKGCRQPEAFGSPVAAFDALRNSWKPDILFVCTVRAREALNQLQSTTDRFDLLTWLPVVCFPDEFARAASLDSNGGWYQPQILFNPDKNTVRMGRRLDALTQHRARWIADRGIVAMIFALSRITGLLIHQVADLQQTQLADALIEQTWASNPLVLQPPQLAVVAETDNHFEGGSVLEATLGLVKATVLWPDLSSLYPNVVREYLADEYPLFARLFSTLIELRQKQVTPIWALTIKVVTNSVFGTRKFGRFPDPGLAARITECGRLVQTESKDSLLRHVGGVSVCAGDTDALAIRLNPNNDTPTTRKAVLAALNGTRKHALYKERMDEFSCVFFVTNKSWAGLRSDNHEIETRGLAQNKSGTPKFVLPAHQEWIRLVLTDEKFQRNADERTRWIEQQSAWLRNTPHRVDDLVVWPKPTRAHMDTERGYLVLAGSREHASFIDYMTGPYVYRPVDVSYLVEQYFTKELLRQHELIKC